MAQPGAVVGRIAALWRYPVKSMGAEALTEADVSWHGLAGDRRWAFVRPGMVRSGFPWQSIREKNDMWHFQPSFVEPERPNTSAIVVRTPGGAAYDVDDPALAAALGEGVTVIKNDRGSFDELPLSIISAQSVDEMGKRAGAEITGLRFRPNLFVDAADGAFAEETWVGATLRIGGLRMRVDARDMRCVMINVDPLTAERNPAVLRVVARERDNYAGVYGSTVQPGRVSVGDDVVVETVS